MKVIYKKLPSKRIPCVATIGVFDGVHPGHRFILKKVRQASRRRKIHSLVITFDVHPRKLLSKGSPSAVSGYIGHIISHQQKKELIEKLGIDYLWFLKTKHSFLKLSAKDFLEYILRHFDIHELIVGEDFHFGHKGKAGVDYLKRIADFYNISLRVIKKIKKNAITLSSSVIRRLIRDGEFRKAKSFLGRSYHLEGKVIEGLGLGESLGFPTANIHVFDYVVPENGVYAACVNIGSNVYLGAVNIGIRPSVTSLRKKVVEAHIINFNKEICGKTLKIYFLEKIREEKKFVSVVRLKNAIRRDVGYIFRKYKRILPHFNI